MPDRIIRDELLQSTRWLDLPTDTHRVVFVGLVLQADDYGNIEGGPRRLYRWMHGFTQIKSEADSIKLMSDLQDVDLVRRYEEGGREYWHIPRFRNLRRYWSRKFPQSPYPENETIPTKQSGSRNTPAGLAQPSANLHRGVGVGVGVGEEKERGVGGMGEGEKPRQPPVDNPPSQPRRSMEKLIADLKQKHNLP